MRRSRGRRESVDQAGVLFCIRRNHLLIQAFPQFKRFLTERPRGSTVSSASRMRCVMTTARRWPVLQRLFVMISRMRTPDPKAEEANMQRMSFITAVFIATVG